MVAELRAVWETAAGIAFLPMMHFAARGDGHTVLVLPGLMANDVSTIVLHLGIQRLGYQTRGWGLGNK